MKYNDPFSSTFKTSVFKRKQSKDEIDLSNTYFSAEIVDIILDTSHVKYVDHRSIGVVFFRKIDSTDNNIYQANPLNPYYKTYPILHEIVLVFSSILYNADVDKYVTQYYYNNIVNIWCINNMNALPYSYDIPENQINDYETNFLSLKTKTQFGNYFVERDDVQILKPYEGDVIQSGRWGNSIRFGSSIKNSKNQWSENSIEGAPITIIRNSNKFDTNELYITEDVNSNHGSSIYLCDGQTISINLTNKTMDANDNINDTIDLPDKWNNGAQLIYTSDRIILNARKDRIILSAKRGISLHTDYICLNSKKTSISGDSFIVDANKEYKFGKNSNQSGMLGDKTKKLISDLIDIILQLKPITGAPGSTTLISSDVVALQKLTQLKTIDLEQILSKKVTLE